MSGVKRYLEDVEERGWRSSPDTVCSRCLHDSALIAAIQQYGGPDECTYCESVPQSPHASAPLDFLTELVVEGLRYEYEDPIESIMVIKGEYQWPCIETLDLLDDLEIADDYRVHYALEKSISTEVWCPRDPYGESDASLTHSAWEKFADLVKTRRRYTSHLHRPSGPHGIDEDNGGPVISKIFEYIQQADLFTTLPAHQKWWRGRISKGGEELSNASDLGPPPVKYAQDNRMSPKGIPIFYGAMTREGAWAEISDQASRISDQASSDQRIYFGQFAPTRSLRFVDLRTHITAPSLFDKEQRHKRNAVEFLRGFTQYLRRPSPPEDEMQIEYIPTQVFAEIVRFELKDSAGRAVDGIIWNSSHDVGSTCCAIFIDKTKVSDIGDREGDTVLTLDSADVSKICSGSEISSG